MAQKIIITAKQVTPPSSGTSFGNIKFSNSEGTYLNTAIEFIADDSFFNFNLVKYNFAPTDLFAQEITKQTFLVNLKELAM
jgi:hypothetical protein